MKLPADERGPATQVRTYRTDTAPAGFGAGHHARCGRTSRGGSWKAPRVGSDRRRRVEDPPESGAGQKRRTRSPRHEPLSACNRSPQRSLDRLNLSVSGDFSSRGMFATARVSAPSIFTVADLCHGTLMLDTRGRVGGQDLSLRHTVRLRTGQHYLARAKAAFRKAG